VKALGWLYWIVWQLVSFALELVGLPLLLPLALFHAWTTRPGKSAMFGPAPVTAWIGGWLTFPWDNEQDGVVPPQMVNGAPYLITYPQWLRAYIWSAWRNPANGMRWAPLAATTFTSKPVVTQSASGYVATYGWRQCIVWHGIRFGWLINPNAAIGDRTWPVLERYP
jgi:hypothetical protein